MLVLSRQIQIIILSRKSRAQEMFSCFQLASVHFQFHVAKTNAVAIAAALNKVVNSVSFRSEWPKHSIPIQKTEQNETNFISF